MAQNGCALSAAEVGKIASLLSFTEMSIDQIAKRMSCSQSTVKKINRTFRVRDYGGRRTSWRTYEHDQREPDLTPIQTNTFFSIRSDGDL